MRTGSRLRSFPALLAAAVLSLAASPSAALTARVAHTATLLPTGDLLIAGGMDNAGTPLKTSDLNLESRGLGFVAGGNMTVARASHTATVLPNGLVLIAGGISNTTCAGVVAPNTVLNCVEIYTPATNSFSAAGISGAMSSPRYNHTATLLNNGSVLLCAGQDTTATVAQSCDYYTPAGATTPGGGTCGSAGGCVNPAAPPGLAFGRAMHTASLLPDGSVWFAGGWNPLAAATNGWTPTTERFSPAGSGSFGSGPTLFEARGLHTAVVMGDGKVLVTGGFNGNSLLGNQGILDTEEIYDPVANSMAPGPQLSTRREMHSAILKPDGTVIFFGGLGNITTTYIPAPVTSVTGLNLTNTFQSLQPNIATGDVVAAAVTLNYPAGLFLSQPVVGTIVDGSILFSTPSFNFGAGTAYWTSGVAASTSVGLQASLAGVSVGCMTPGAPPANNCGYIAPAQLMPVLNLGQATWSFNPLTGAPANGAATGGTIFFGSDLKASNSPEPIGGGSTLNADITIAMPLVLLGATISSGTVAIRNPGNATTLTQTSSFTLVLNGGSALIPASTVVVSDGGGGAKISFAANFTNLAGQIFWAGSAGSYTLPSPSVNIPEPGTSPGVTINADVNYVASMVTLTGSFSVDVDTIVIRSMILDNPEYYSPKANQASFTVPGGVADVLSAANARAGQTATLLTNNDIYLSGGYNCSTPGLGICGPLTAQAFNLTYIPTYANSTSAGALTAARALHTATLLPDGTIMAAGGTNGPNILSSAEIYSPASGTSAPTVTGMTQPRDQHTSTLLPNGRVLIAGGYTTNGVVSDATMGSEIYYPDTKFFIPTSSMSIPRFGHTATMLSDGTVMVVGGLTTGGVVTGSAEIYRSTTSAWENSYINQNLPPLRAHTATLLKDGRLLVVGGTNSGGPLNTVYAYNPAAPAAGWVAQDPLPHHLYSHTATLLFDGRVLVAGGNDGFGEYNASYIFDPLASAGSQWTSTLSPLQEARFGHTATLLPNQTVMITGGSVISGIVPPQIEIFDVSASSWTSGGVFNDGPRAFNTMTLAPDGNVYALGGSNGTIGGPGTSVLAAVDRLYFTAVPDAFSKNAPPSARQAVVGVPSAAPLQAGPGPLPANGFTVTGTRFRGATEASGGGSASANSSFSFPHLILQQIEGSGGGSSQGNSGFVVDLTTQIYLNAANFATENSSLTVSLPATAAQLPAGWYNARVGANGIYSNGVFVQVGPAKPAFAPTVLPGTALGISSITWRWNSVAGADGYDVYQSSTGVFIGTAAATGSPSFIQTGLPPNAQVQILVAAYTMSGDGPSALSPFASVSPTTAISLIGCGVNNSGNTTTSIQWSWSDAGSVLHYNVYNSSTGVVISTAPNGNPNFTDVGLGTNTQRSIYVAAVTADGQGPLSASASCYTLAAAPGLINPPLISTETTSVFLDWANNGNPSSTTYQAALTSYAGGVLVTTITVTQNAPGLLSAYFPGLSPSSYYSASVVAVNGAGVFSAPLLGGTTFTLPAQPQPLTIQGTTPFSITASWNTNSNSTMTFYQLTYSTDSNFVTNVATAVPFSSRSNSSTFTITGLLTSVQYWLRVQAENPFGETSPFSGSVATVTFNGGAPPGSLAGVLASVGTSEIFGNLGGPSARIIDMRSPGGAFPADTGVTISTYDINPLDHGALCPNGVPGAGGSGVALSIVDSPALQPTHPIFLSASYANTELGPTPISQLSLARFDPASGTCVPLQTTFDAATHMFLAELNHFSLYQLVAVPLATSADTARIFPNPYRAATDGFVTIDQIPPASRVRVFTLRGERILDAAANGAGNVTWTADNSAGRPVASGLYLVVVEAGGTKKIMKLAVIR